MSQTLDELKFALYHSLDLHHALFYVSQSMSRRTYFLGRLRTTQKPPVRLDPSLVLRMGVKSGEGGKLNKDERECSNYCKYGN